MKSLSFLFLLLCTASCTTIYTARGAYYRIRPGDTLASVAGRHHVELQDLAEINNIENSKELKVGQNLYIPGATVSSFDRIIQRERRRSKNKKERTPWKHSKPSPSSETSQKAVIETDRGRFTWPIHGTISSLYGMRNGRRHDGIDIAARSGTPITAAADGEVVYSKRMRGYGNLVLLKHTDDFFTVYAHNSVNLVKQGAKIRKGQVVAKVGRTGRATGPHLHFEVREGTRPRNPLFFLPKTRYAGKNEGGPKDGIVEDENP